MKNKSLINVITVKSRLKITGKIINENIDKGNFLDIGCFDKSLKRLLKTEIKYEVGREGDIVHSLSDATKARDILSFEPNFELREGLKNTIEWFKRQV
jgi:nucleoside-diphosphate-sugar epimerase